MNDNPDNWGRSLMWLFIPLSLSCVGWFLQWSVSTTSAGAVWSWCRSHLCLHQHWAGHGCFRIKSQSIIKLVKPHLLYVALKYRFCFTSCISFRTGRWSCTASGEVSIYGHCVLPVRAAFLSGWTSCRWEWRVTWWRRASWRAALLARQVTVFTFLYCFIVSVNMMYVLLTVMHVCIFIYVYLCVFMCVCMML